MEGVRTIPNQTTHFQRSNNLSITDVLYSHPRERHITDVEDNTVLEVSLGEPGASARAKAV